MPGTRTSPAATAPMSSRLITYHFIDASGDLTTEALIVPIAATAAQIEAVAATYQLASNASLWAITDTQLREGIADPDNALAEYRGSVKDGINLAFKNLTTRQAQAFRVVAPVEETMQGNQDIPLLSSDEMTNLIVALLALLTVTYDFQRAQYTERRERKNNPVIK